MNGTVLYGPRDVRFEERSTPTKPLLPALAELVEKKDLWVNALRIEGATQFIQGIELSSWRTNTGKIAKWSGLDEEGDSDEPPVLILKSDADAKRTTWRWTCRSPMTAL